MFVNGCGFGDWGSQILETAFVVVSRPGRREDQWSEILELCGKNLWVGVGGDSWYL